MDTYTKSEDGELEVTKAIPEEIIPAKEEVKTYDYDFLVKQKVQVEQDLENIVTRHATELAVAQANVDEVNLLLAEANKLGIVEKVESIEEVLLIIK